MNQAIPILSLAIALLAVFVGPLVSWWITKHQLELARRVAHKQTIAPMRQAWINELRKKLSELLASATFCNALGLEQRTDDEYKRIFVLQQEVQLTVNLREEAHKALVASISKMLALMGKGQDSRHEFKEAHQEAVRLAQDILKTEWDRVKEEV